MGKAGLGPNYAFANTWSKALVFLRLTDTLRMEFYQVVLDFSYCDLRGADGLCWDTWPVGEGIFFTGSCRILGVGTMYVTSLDN